MAEIDSRNSHQLAKHLQELSNRLDGQDNFLTDMLKNKARPEVSITHFRTIKGIFNDIQPLVPGLQASREFHKQPHAIRSNHGRPFPSHRQNRGVENNV